MNHEPILAAYRTHHDALHRAAAAIETSLHEELRAARLEVHFVASRVKTEPSLRAKLARPDKTYRTLWDVTDLVGLRVSTYFEDTIEDVARLVEGLFVVDFRHSTDKLRFRDHGRFGYRSMHYVCAMPDELPREARFELQIRTALQHAWAEVEHDLGYKAENVVPEIIKRRFSRVASLLEIADQEFVSIRRDLRAYRDAAHEHLARGDGDEALPLDALSLEALCRSPHLQALDTQLATVLDKPLSDELFYPDYLARMARLAGLDTVQALRACAEEHRDTAIALAPAYFSFSERALGLALDSFPTIQRGYSLLFVTHAALLRGPELGLSKVARLTRMYAELDFGGDERRAHEVVSDLIAALGPI